ncbi:MAG TPA: fatty acid desaturase [Chthoniobacterales bacterium]|nr:fatty acid desaturase [Chthoniobacterales bacterium]
MAKIGYHFTPMHAIHDVASERLQTDSRLFAYTRWDVVPVAAELLHLAYFFGLFFLFPHAPLWLMLILGFFYSISISWNINGISHNFIHNPYFRSPFLNRLFSLLESISVGFSQVFYDVVHMQHHKGNADRPNDKGETIDWLSIYKHGHDGEPEHPLSYTFLSFFREDPKTVFKALVRKDKREAVWGLVEIALFIATFVTLGILNWHYIIFLLGFWYLGHCLSYLNGYYLHYGANPDEPIAWGVSSYDKLYNWLWFFNGYHAEHHFRPKVHWTRMQAFRDQIVEEQRAARVRIIKPPHALGFLDPDLPKLGQTQSLGRDAALRRPL